MKILIPLFVVLALSACAAQQHELAMPSGDWHQMNAGKWDYNPNALTTPPVVPARS